MKRNRLFFLVNEYKYLLSLIFIIIVGLWVAPNYISYKDNFWNLAALSSAIIGLFYTVDERRSRRFITTYDDISRAIALVESRITAEMKEKDSTHDKRIVELMTEISFLSIRLTSHSGEYGHEKIVEEVLKIKDQMSDLNANVVFLTEQGAIVRQLDRVKKDTARLEQLVRQMSAKNPD